MTGGWRERAACRGFALSLFFPERGETTAAAKAVCQTCPVIADCLAWAMRTGDAWAVLGGLSSDERAAVRRGRKPRIPRAHRPCGTPARYKAHILAGEVPDAACRRAEAQRRAQHRQAVTA